MRVNCVSQNTFQAQLPKRLREELFEEACKRGGRAPEDFWAQSKKITEWGLDTSALATVENKGEPKILCLVNSYEAPFKKVLLDIKNTFYDSFIALTEKDIVSAEYKMKI